MQFFLDTADIDEIRDLSSTGLIDGITTNPSILAKAGRPALEVLKDICAAVQGPVSAEVVATDAHEMVQQGQKLVQIAENIVVKLPITWDGLKACKTLSQEGIDVNMTLCFTSAQALLAAKAGARFVSPFVGRLDDIGHVGLDLIQDIRLIYDQYPDLETDILVASIRQMNHVMEAARIGAEVVTCPPAIIRQMVSHPLTDKGLEGFLRDWQKSGQTL